MTTNEEAVANMEHAFNLIVNYEFAWDQDHWRVASSETACGTALCFAGWATAASTYEPLIEKPKQLAEEVGSWYQMQEEIEDAVWGFLVIPDDDPYAADPGISRTMAYVLDNYIYGESSRVLKERWGGHGTDRIIDVQGLANRLLNVQTPNNPQGILDVSVFDGGNRLETIRRHIDSARSRAGLPERNFKTEPVDLIFDEWVPDEARPGQVARVAAFNERAQGPDRIILAEREAALLAGLPGADF